MDFQFLMGDDGVEFLMSPDRPDMTTEQVQAWGTVLIASAIKELAFTQQQTNEVLRDIQNNMYDIADSLEALKKK